MERETLNIWITSSTNSTRPGSTIRIRKHRLLFAIGTLLIAPVAMAVGVAWLLFQSPQWLGEALPRSGFTVSLDRLETEIARLRDYESQLRTRADMLDAILGETVSPTEQERENLEATPNDPSQGIGGGDPEDDFPTAAMHNSSLEELGREQQSLLEKIDYQIDRLSNLPIGTPVEGYVTSGWGQRRSPFTHRRQMHRGIDFGVSRRSRVVSTADGIVVYAGYKGAYGRTVIIDHGNGIETLYGHLSKLDVRAGERVCRGEQIALVGSTGRSTGPHVHYEVIVDGVHKNPTPFVQLTSFLKMASEV